jgi:hypothetical protein
MYNEQTTQIQSTQQLLIQMLNDRFGLIEQMLNERLPKPGTEQQ